MENNKEMTFLESVRISSVADAYQEYSKLKENPKSSKEDISKAKNKLYYSLKKYKNYRNKIDSNKKENLKENCDEIENDCTNNIDKYFFKLEEAENNNQCYIIGGEAKNMLNEGKNIQYTKYVIEHIYNVKSGYRWLKKNLPELFENQDKGKITRTILKHDLSKFSPKSEFKPYREHFYGDKDEKEEEKFTDAWNHHQKMNKHHWQYWVMADGDGKNYALDMPYENIIEMICDWWAFSRLHENLYEIFQWYNSNKSKMILSQKTRKTVERILSKIKKKLDEQKNNSKSLEESRLPENENIDPEFGIPEEKKYPLFDEDHVKSAIKFFNYAEPKYRKELASNIKSKMKKYNISNDTVGEDNELKKYLTESSENIKESFDPIILKASEVNRLKTIPISKLLYLTRDEIKNEIKEKHNGKEISDYQIPKEDKTLTLSVIESYIKQNGDGDAKKALADKMKNLNKFIEKFKNSDNDAANLAYGTINGIYSLYKRVRNTKERK